MGKLFVLLFDLGAVVGLGMRLGRDWIERGLERGTGSNGRERWEEIGKIQLNRVPLHELKVY